MRADGGDVVFGKDAIQRRGWRLGCRGSGKSRGGKGDRTFVSQLRDDIVRHLRHVEFRADVTLLRLLAGMTSRSCSLRHNFSYGSLPACQPAVIKPASIACGFVSP